MAAENARDLARGYRFGRTLPRPAESRGKAEAPGRLERYFDEHTSGPGIWKWRHYFDIYERHVGKFVNQGPDVVEIGIYSGGSLDMWHAYFGPDTTVYGIDIEAGCKAYARPGTRIFIGDQADPGFWSAFLAAVPAFDIVIDDGGHKPHQQIASLEAVLPHLRPGGVYVCEDIHGAKNTFHAYVDGLARSLHPMAAAGSDGFATNAMQSTIQSIHVYPFVTIIEKRTAPLAWLEGPKRGTQWQPFYAPQDRESF